MIKYQNNNLVLYLKNSYRPPKSASFFNIREVPEDMLAVIIFTL